MIVIIALSLDSLIFILFVSGLHVLGSPLAVWSKFKGIYKITCFVFRVGGGRCQMIVEPPRPGTI